MTSSPFVYPEVGGWPILLDSCTWCSASLDHVSVTKDAVTGVATILVDQSGESSGTRVDQSGESSGTRVNTRHQIVPFENDHDYIVFGFESCLPPYISMNVQYVCTYVYVYVYVCMYVPVHTYVLTVCMFMYCMYV